MSEFKFSNKPAEFVAKFPYGKIPTFEDSEGWKLLEGVPIARYREQVSFPFWVRVLSHLSV